MSDVRAHLDADADQSPTADADRLARATAGVGTAREVSATVADGLQREVRELYQDLQQLAGEAAADAGGPAAAERRFEINDLIAGLRAGDEAAVGRVEQVGTIALDLIAAATADLGRRQEGECETATAGSQDRRGELSHRHQQERDSLASLVERTMDEVGRIGQDLRDRQRSETPRLAAAVVEPDPRKCLDGLERAVADQRTASEQATRAGEQILATIMAGIVGIEPPQPAPAATAENAELTRPSALRRLAAEVAGEIELSARVDGRIQAALDEARHRLQQSQATERNTAVGLPAPAQAELEQRHRQQRDDLAKLVEHATNGRQRNETEMLDRQQSDRVRAAGAALGPDADAALRESLAEQSRELRQTGRTQRRLLNFVNGAAAVIATRLQADQCRQLRAATGLSADRLDDAALQRVVQAGNGRGAGRVDAAKGQLAEELNNRRVTDRLAQVEQLRDFVFIAGDRIRDGLGNRMTDGVLARQLADGDWEVLAALEVKAGAPAARGLDAESTADDSAEARRSARDDAVAELADLVRVQERKYATKAEEAQALDALTKARQAPATQDARNRADVRLVARLDPKVLDALVEQKLRALPRSEAGQIARTTERLEQQRIFVDGLQFRRAWGEDHRLVRPHAVVPRDVRLATPATQRARQDDPQLHLLAKTIAELGKLQESETELKQLAQAMTAVAATWPEP